LENYAGLFLLFILTLVSSTTANLRSVLLVKGDKVQTMVITAIDATVYAYLFKNLTRGDDIYSVLVYVLGKCLAVELSNILLSRTNKTVYKCNVYLNSYEASGLESFLFAQNISFSRVEETFLHSERIKVIMHVTRQQYQKMLEYLKSVGIDNPTLDLSEVKVKGNIERRTYGK